MTDLRVSNRSEFEAWSASAEAVARQRVVYAGPDPQYGIGLDRMLPGYGIACVEAGPTADTLAAEGADVHVYEPDPNDSQVDERERSRVRNTPALISSAAFAAWLREGSAPLLSARDRPRTAPEAVQPHLLVFKNSHAIEARCEEMGWGLLASPSKLTRRWENKVAFEKIARSLGLPRPEAIDFDPGRIGYDALQARLGADLVLQAPHGYSGAKTWRVRGPEDFEALRPKLRGRRLRAAAYRAGLPVTLNACVTRRGVACSLPFLQVTGDPLLTPHRLGSCGNDWSGAARIGDPAPYVDLAARIGAGLSEAGFRGIFGVDFVRAEDGRILVIEVNPRLVASIALYTQLELKAARLPLLARHLLAFLDPEADAAPLDLHLVPIDGGQLILHELENRARRVRGALEGGVYDLDEIVAAQAALPLPADAGSDGETPSRIERKRAAVRVDESLEPREILVLAPAHGESISAGAAFARIQSGAGVTDAEGTLLPELRAAVRWLRREVDLG